MTSTPEFIAQLKALDIRLIADGDRLRCDAPQGSLTGELRAELASRKAELLSFLQQSLPSVPPPITPVERDRPLPLAFGQQRLWFLEQLEEQSAVYNEWGGLELRGTLHREALEKSLMAVVQRHQVLRTTISEVKGVPFQVIHPPALVDLPVLDLQSLPTSQQTEAVQHQALELVQTPFDLTRDVPLLRARLLRLGNDHYVLLLVTHHIAFDNWSTGILLRELVEGYRAYSQNQTPALPELPLQYADFASWQRQWLQQGVLEPQLQYWQQQLAGLPPVLDLPCDRPRPAVQTFRGATVPFTLGADLSQQLKGLSQQTGTTLFMVLLAGLALLLSRYSRQEDLAIGTPAANRNRAELEGLIGFFVNNLVLRVQTAGNPSFSTLLTQVRQTTLNAYDHAEVPFDLLVDALHPERNLSYSPLFQVMLVFRSAALAPQSLPELAVTPLEFPHVVARFDLEVHISATEAGIQGYFLYNQDLFEASTIERMVGHYEQLLAAVVAEPGRPIASLNYLGAAEREQLLVGWNQTATDYPKDSSIPACFEQQAAATPEAMAVEFGLEQLSYGQLNRRANQLARHLQVLGLQAQQLVAVYGEAGVDLVVALLAILKAGGAYLPLDRAYPAERIATILTDAAPPILLTQSSVQSDLPEFAGQRLCLDQLGDTLAGYGRENLELPIAPQDLAYVIYTSGSTGLPKGVMVPHQGVLRLVLHTNYVHLTPEDRLAQVSNLAFDAATFEVWGALLNGGVLVGIERQTLLSAPELVEQLRQRRITAMFLTAALFNRVVGLIPDAFKTLKYLLVGGEALDPRTIRLALQGGAPQQIINGYGPTENTTFSVCHRVGAVPEETSSIPIGRPIANTQCYVLDSQQQLVPVGVAGELFLGGDGLALGYLNRDQLNAEKFVAHPFAPGERLYRTGDLVRWLPDGTLEFLGRLDNQVKLRGFRIELGEIERTLEQHPQVETAVVLCQQLPDQKRLVAYLVGGAVPLGQRELREFLKQRLPDYMVPAAFVWLPELPLTPNGKLDLRSLPQPDFSQSLELSATPRTPAEATLAQIWATTLRLDQVGIYDNFFELGGDSILSIQIIVQARQAGLHLTPKQLFQHQTIAELAAIASPLPSVVQVNSEPVTGPVPLTPIQQWFFERELPDPHHFNQSMLLEVPADLDPERLRRAVRQCLLHHDGLRSQFHPHAEGWQQQQIEFQESVPFQWVDLSPYDEAQQAAHITETTAQLQRSLDLASGNLLQVTLFHRGPTQPAQLFLVIHHLVVDGVSWRILLEDLITAYQQGDAAQLPAKTTPFQSWSQQLHQYAQSEAIATEIPFWLAQLSGPAPSLPVDFPLEPQRNTVASTAVVTVSLSPGQTDQLLHQVPKAYKTQINDVLLSALVQSFAQWTGEPTLLLDLEGHGREPLFETVDLSRTVGWFTTIFPVRLSLNPNQPPIDHLKAIKEQLRQVPQRGIGYGLLRYLRQDPSLRQRLQAAPPAVSFNYLGQFDAPFLEAAQFRLSQNSIQADRSTQGLRSHLLEVDGLVVGDRLQFLWSYSDQLHRQATIEHLAQSFRAALEGLIASCLSDQTRGYTPSDFPEADLNQDELDQLLAEIDLVSMED